MRSALVAFVILLAPSASLKVGTVDQEWTRPVTKVVNLLKEMQAQIAKEAADDAAMFEQMGCWCETNENEKTKAIDSAQARITDLNAAIPEYAAKASQLDVEIKQLTKEVAQKSTALDEATQIRANEQAEFRSNEKDMISSVTAMKGAVRTLGNFHDGASLAQMQGLLRDQMQKHRSVLSSSTHRQILSFVQQPVALLQQAIPMKGQGTQSGVIFGILKQMKEEFETNIATSQKEEDDAVSQFAALKKAKSSEIKAAQGLIETKTVQMAEAKEKNAVSKEDLEDTRKALSADNEFLSNIRLKCQSADKDYQDRQKVRNEEQVAVSETIEILSNDDAKDQFNKSMSFLQMALRTVRKSSRDRAADVLRKAGIALRKPKLVNLATAMKLSGFEKVKEAIDNMVVALKDEQKVEVEQKDYCVSSFNENDSQTAAKMDTKGDLEQKISTLSNTIEELTDAIAQLKAEIAETQLEMKKASQLRESANHEFQVTVNDQRATQAVLKKAIDKLKSFYDKKAAALVQQESQAPGEAPPAPPAQATYKKSGGAAGVMTMIETLIEESKELEADVMKAESDAQAAYESFMKDSTAAVDAASRDVTNKSEELAKADGAKVAATGDLAATVDDLLSLGEYSQQLHKQCDFLVKNFDLRQSSRTQEMEALNQAKAIFSGAKL